MCIVTGVMGADTSTRRYKVMELCNIILVEAVDEIYQNLIYASSTINHAKALQIR